MKGPSEGVLRALQSACAGERLTIDVVSGRLDRFFPRAGTTGPRVLHSTRSLVTIRDLADAPTRPAADVVVLQCHLHRGEPSYLRALRDAGYPGVIVGWFWDNHHAKGRNREVAALVDVGIAAHHCHSGYLREQTLLLPPVMLCSTQWTRDEAAALWASRPPCADRSRELSGGFGRYGGSARTAWLERLIAEGRYPALHFIDDERTASYFRMTGAERFREWTRHAVSLCVPYRDDLSNRFFDAWLAGQMPVVTPDIADLALPWAQPHRDRDFVCAASYDEADIRAAHLAALRLFDAGGIAGQEARHRLALEHHLFEQRIDRIAGLLRDAAAHGFDAAHP
jgi:hypothetical protein